MRYVAAASPAMPRGLLRYVEMTAARSLSPFAAHLFEGPAREGVALGHVYIRFDDDAVALTPPRAMRMPNGIEAEVILARGQSATIGDGALLTGAAVVTAGPI